jgi:O-antigen/teichoic acid export membrane protein
MSLKKVFIKDSMLYGITSYLSLLTGIILTPIYTRVLSKEEFGLMDLYNTLNNFALLIIPLGLTTAIIRNYSEIQSDSIQKKQSLGTLLFTLITGCILYVYFSLFFADFLRNHYFKSNIDALVYNLSLGIVSTSVLTSYFQSLNRIQFKIKQYVLINTIPFILMVIGGYYLVVNLKMGIRGFFFASFFGQLTGLVMAIVLGLENIKLSFNIQILIKALKYSIPFVFVLIFMRFTNIIDRFLISNILDLRANGDYSIAMRINNVFQIFISAFSTAWFPYAMSIIKMPNRNQLYRKAFKYYLIGFGFLCFSVILFTKELLLFFAPKYIDIELIIYPLLLSSLVAGCSYFFGLGVQIRKNTYLMIVSSCAAFTVNVVISYVATLYLGLFGIVLGTLVSSVVWVVIEYFLSKKSTILHFSLTKLWLTLFTVTILSVLCFALNSFSLVFWQLFIIKLVLFTSSLFYIIRKNNFVSILKLNLILPKNPLLHRKQ